ncbi:MAG TPA: mucin-associated surface protein [Arthrobacter sp.]|nr:mucin-associated surface protein [Arthrobacter sp.]
MSRRIRRSLAAPVLAAALLAGSLAGCSGPATDLDSAAAGQLQSRVLAVTQAVAADDTAGAVKLLDELNTALDVAAADGKVSFKRHQSIKSSIDAVRADLTAKIAQQQAAAAAAKAAADQAAAAQAAQDAEAKAAVEQAAADQAAAQAAAQQAQAPAAPSGKAKGKSKGGG